MRKKVLVLAKLDAVHTARWLRQFKNDSIDFLLFPTSPHRRLSLELESLLSEVGIKSCYRIIRFGKGLSIFWWLLDKIAGNRVRATILSKLVSTWKPEIIHAIEFQQAGYIVLRAVNSKKMEMPRLFILTNWGSDIFWFSRFSSHKLKIEELLHLADKYSAECSRDVSLAKQLGYKGVVLPVVPNSGGFSKSQIEKALKNTYFRELIVIKGYHGWAGRALLALFALIKIRGSIKEYRVVTYSSNLIVQIFSKLIALIFKIRITSYPKFALRHEEVLELFSRAAIYVGISRTDGISTSMLEAMLMGAIPVQTATACCDEWIIDGSGVIVRRLDVQNISNCILQALVLSKNSEAQKTNLRTILNKATEDKVAGQIFNFYQ